MKPSHLPPKKFDLELERSHLPAQSGRPQTQPPAQSSRPQILNVNYVIISAAKLKAPAVLLNSSALSRCFYLLACSWKACPLVLMMVLIESQAAPLELETASKAGTADRSVVTEVTAATYEGMLTESERLLQVVKDCFKRALFQVTA